MNPSSEEIISKAVGYGETSLDDPIIWTLSNWFDAVQDWFPELPSNAFTQGQHVSMMVAANKEFRERHPTEWARADAEQDARLEREEQEEGETDGPAEDGTPFLLPIAGMPGYSVDPWGRPHAEKKRGRKSGPLACDKFFQKKGAGRGPRFICGYRVRVGAKRKRFRPTYFLMARFFAEQKWMDGDN